jgi:hypothetical protein
MGFWALLATFAPWIALKVIVLVPFAHPLVVLKVAVGIAAAICAVQAVRDRVRGVIFWGTIAFFLFALVTIVGMTNMWVITHMGVLAQLNLVAMAGGSLLFKRPFTMAFARQHVPEHLWTTERFIRKNYEITGAWTLSFLVGLVIVLLQEYHVSASPVLMELVNDGAILAAIGFTMWYSRPAKTASEMASSSASGN